MPLATGSLMAAPLGLPGPHIYSWDINQAACRGAAAQRSITRGCVIGRGGKLLSQNSLGGNVKPTVSLMNRRDLIKTFQTSFGLQFGAVGAPPLSTLNTLMI